MFEGVALWWVNVVNKVVKAVSGSSSTRTSANRAEAVSAIDRRFESGSTVGASICPILVALGVHGFVQSTHVEGEQVKKPPPAPTGGASSAGMQVAKSVPRRPYAV